MLWILALFAGSMLVWAQTPAAAQFQEGLAAIQKGDFATAEAHVRAGLTSDPDAAAGYDLLGIALDAQGKSEAAEESFRKAIRLNPRLVPAHNNLGHSFYRRSKIDLARSQFLEALKLDPANFTANYSLGLIARDSKQYVEATQYLNAAHRARPADGPTLLALAEVCLDAGQTDVAVRFSALLAARDPSDASAHFSLGVLFLQHQLYEQAVEHLAQARLAEPRNFELLHNLGQAYAHLNRYSEAEKTLLNALQVHPDSPETLYQLARVYSQQGQSDQAIQVLVRARQMAPESPDVLLLLGRECIREGFWDDAESVLRECIRLNPAKVEPRLLLGESYSRSKAYEKALAEYEVIAKLDVNNPQSYVSLGRTYYYCERYPESQAALAKARKLDPANAQAAYYLGLIAEKNDDDKTAEAWFEEALKTDPKHLGTLYEYGALMARHENFRRARTYLERASQVSPGFSQTYYRLTLVYKKLNETELSAKAFARFQQCKKEEERANYRPYGVLAFVKETQDLPETDRLRRYRSELARAQQSRPKDINVMLMLAQIDLRLGDTGESIEAIRKLTELVPDDAQVRLRVASLLTAFHLYPIAVRQLREFLDRHSTEQDVRFALAALCANLFRSVEAIQVLRSGGSSDALPAAHRNLLGRLLIRGGEFAEGLRNLRAASAAEPRNEEFSFDLALGLAETGNQPAALDRLAKAKSKSPASARIYMVEGLCRQVAGDSQGADAAFRRAADLSNEWEAPWLARTAFGRADAASDIRQAADLFPASPWPSWIGGNLEHAAVLAPNAPQVYAPLLVAALQRNDCVGATRLWARMRALEIAPELDANRWCRGDARLPKSVADRYSPLAMLIELARGSAAAPVVETDFAKGTL
jgi:tetratricopeptide (TPR) repeat protein